MFPCYYPLLSHLSHARAFVHVLTVAYTLTLALTGRQLPRGQPRCAPPPRPAVSAVAWRGAGGTRWEKGEVWGRAALVPAAALSAGDLWARRRLGYRHPAREGGLSGEEVVV